MRSHDAEDWGPLLSNPGVETSVRRRGWAAYIRQLDDESNKRLLTGEQRELVNKVVHHASMSEHEIDEQLVQLVRAKLPHVHVNEMHESGPSSWLGLPGWLTFNRVFFGLIILSCMLGPLVHEYERQDYLLQMNSQEIKGMIHELECLKATVQELEGMKAAVQDLGRMKAVILVEAVIIGALVCSCLFQWSGIRLTIPHWPSLWTSLIGCLRVNGKIS